MSLIKKLLGRTEVSPKLESEPVIEIPESPAPKKKVKKGTQTKKKPATKKATTKKPAAKTTRKKKVVQEEMSEKEYATSIGQPYVKVVNFELADGKIGDGSFELDFNEFFVAKLIKSGYTGESDAQIVDRWFTDICRNVALEMWEQYEADPTNRRKDLGDGFSEIS